MNKTAIKNYAIWARKELIERVTRKAYEYGIEKNKQGNKNEETINGKLLSKQKIKQRKELIQKINENGFDQVMEEVAYTWFNRFIALRFMEVNNYLPNRIRLFTNEFNELKPQILEEALNVDLEGLDPQRIYDLLQANDRQELYKELIIASCDDMGNYLPGMFTKINDYKVLLFPDNLLNNESVIGRMISDIDEDSWIDSDLENDTSNGITIIGWLYQYYISERHDQVVNILKGKVKKEDIPAATQLWTTDWVVRYMVDNSLGRYWFERNPDSALKDKLTYLATSKTNDLQVINETVNPQEITFLDPCMGSGHILVYAFDVLMEIYKECGYSARDAAINIVQKNLYGLDIDDRAYQLSYFAVMMRARKYNRRVLTRNVSNNLASIQETNSIEQFAYPGIANNEDLNQLGEYLIHIFKDAKEIGSLITVKEADYETFEQYVKELQNDFAGNFDAIEWQNRVLPFMKKISNQARILSRKYTICTTNPPYLNKMEGKLKAFVIDHYKDYSTDLFAVFMRRNFDFTIKGGYLGFMTPFVWMFIKSYEKLREFIIKNKGIATLIQFEYSAYDEATVPICSFVLSNSKDDKVGYYYRLSDFKGGMEVQKQKFLEAQKNKNCGYFYETDEENYSKIPGSPIAYWAKSSVFEIFENENIGDWFDVKAGICTGKNDEFIFQWHELDFTKSSLMTVDYRYTPHNKGGEYRKWYGNRNLFLKYNKKSIERMETFPGFRHDGKEYYFKKHIGWSKITSSKSSFRYYEKGFTFDSAGLGLFSDKANIDSTLALLNSKVTEYLLSILNPTLNVTPMIVKELPYININENDVVSGNISLSKQDWDSFETSWDFEVHPLVKNREIFSTVREAYSLWDAECSERFNTLKANEEELNRIFIDIYGLQDELDPYEEDKDVTVRKADLDRDIRSFISYAVGCMFGRYSLDVPGLAFAGGTWDTGKYTSYIPDADNIIPISSDEYFEDDIVDRFVRFVEVVYGKETLEENLDFIASVLGGKGTSRKVIRDYFLKDFYKDHCKIYQKRPIYWLFDSGKKNGFKALMYIHRYQPDLIARLRTQYVFEQQARYRNMIEMDEKLLDGALTSSERVRLNKELKALKGQDEELRKYEEDVHHYADMMLPMDLDDGVKVNYEKFGKLLAKIK